MKEQKSEKGQIIVILALALVAILAITALAIDGSLNYNQRRTDQSTSDSAALAGAGAAANLLKEIKPSDFSCGSGVGATAATAAVLAVQASAAYDDVTLPNRTSMDDLLTAQHGIRVECGTDELGMQYLDVNVMVSTDTETTFAQVINVETLGTTVRAVARVYPRQPFAYGNGLVSCSSNCSTKQGGIEFGGTGFTFINAAGVFSNSCIKAQSNSSEVTVVGGSIQYTTTCPGCADANITPDPVQSPTSINCDFISPPTCSDSPYVTAPTSGTINPGNYQALLPGSGNALILNPGVYCLKPDNSNKPALQNNAKSTLKGTGVTLFIQDGNVTLNTNDNAAEDWGVSLTAPDCDGEGCGLLMYFAKDKTADVQINGGAKNYFEGTIFGPTANFTLNGGATTSTFNTQIIGNWIEVTGKSQLIMDLDSSVMAKEPAKLSLIK